MLVCEHVCVAESQSAALNLAAVAVAVGVTLRCESRGGHVGASYRLDLCDAAKLSPVQQLKDKAKTTIKQVKPYRFVQL